MGAKNRDLILILILCFISISLLAACQSKGEINPEKQVAVEIATSSRGDIYNTILLSAQFFPKNNAMILPKTPGINVVDIKVELGDYVKEGDFLFELDKTLIRKQVNQAKEAYDLARKNYERQKQEYTKMKNNSTGAMEAMALLKGVSNEYLKEQLELENNHMLEAAATQVDQARSAYANVLSQLSEMDYFAPSSGVVSQINIRTNQPITNSQPAIIISNTNTLNAIVHMSGKLIGGIHKGASVPIEIEGDIIEGRIAAINPIPDPKSNLYGVEIDITNDKEIFRPGSFGKVIIERDRMNEVIIVPKISILQDEKGNYLFIEKDGIAHRREVILGTENEKQVAVVEGLTEGERIIIRGQQYVKEGKPVVVVRGESNENK